MDSEDELRRIRNEFARRDASHEIADRYSLSNLANRFALSSRERSLLALLREAAALPLTGQRLLDVGCGTGGELERFESYGVRHVDLFGIDLMQERALSASQVAAPGRIVCGDGGRLPFRGETFDIVMLFTVLTSVLDPAIRARIAAESMRVLRPRGVVIWYDFIWNPTNSATRGIGRRGLQTLFPDSEIRLSRTTLAPPLARLVVPRSVALGRMLERIPPLRSHYLAVIRPARSASTSST